MSERDNYKQRNKLHLTIELPDGSLIGIVVLEGQSVKEVIDKVINNWYINTNQINPEWYPGKIYLSEKCPKCNGDLLLKRGRYDFFAGCSEYPECPFMRKASKEEKELAAIQEYKKKIHINLIKRCGGLEAYEMINDFKGDLATLYRDKIAINVAGTIIKKAYKNRS